MEWDRVGFEDQSQGVGVRLAAKRGPASQHLIQGYAQGVDIGRRADLATAARSLLGAI